MAFDLTTHPRCPKSGRILRENPYRLLIKQNAGGGNEWLYERPVGSGVFYYADGSVAEEASKAGLARQEQELRDESRTALEKAQAAHEHTAAQLKAAEAAHRVELAAQAHAAKPAHERAQAHIAATATQAAQIKGSK